MNNAFDTCTNTREVQATFTAEQTKLFEQCGVFFAFSRGQLAEGLRRIGFVEGEHKLRELGAGGYCFSHHAEAFNQGLEALVRERNRAVKRLLTDDQIILRALENFECFYTGDVEDAYEELKHQGYSLEDCWRVYKNELQNR